mgnify:CR=1 FL=1
MKKEIQKSITFLMSEFKRLKKLNAESRLSKEEKEKFEKLSSFLGQNKK